MRTSVPHENRRRKSGAGPILIGPPGIRGGCCPPPPVGRLRSEFRNRWKSNPAMSHPELDSPKRFTLCARRAQRGKESQPPPALSAEPRVVRLGGPTLATRPRGGGVGGRLPRPE